MLQEGVIGVEPDFLKMNNGKAPPVIHVDSTAPLYSDKTKKLITDKIWGIYYKPDIDGLGVQGGTSPYIVDKHFQKIYQRSEKSQGSYTQVHLKDLSYISLISLQIFFGSELKLNTTFH